MLTAISKLTRSRSITAILNNFIRHTGQNEALQPDSANSKMKRTTPQELTEYNNKSDPKMSRQHPNIEQRNLLYQTLAKKYRSIRDDIQQ